MWFSEAVTGTEYLCLIGNAAQQIEQTQSRLPQLDALVIVIFIFTHVMRRLQMPSVGRISKRKPDAIGRTATRTRARRSTDPRVWHRFR
jgi:hypothetical protein